MLTKNDLSSIQKLVRGEVQGSEQRLGDKIVNAQRDIRNVEDKLTLKMQVVEKKLGAKIDKVQESVDIVQGVVVEHYGKLEKRVVDIEEELNMPKSL